MADPIYDQDQCIDVSLSLGEIQAMDNLLCQHGLNMTKQRGLHIKLRIAEMEIAQRRHPSHPSNWHEGG